MYLQFSRVFFNYQHSTIVSFPNLLGASFADIENILDTFPNIIQLILFAFENFFVMFCFTQFNYLIKIIYAGHKKTVQFLFFVAFLVAMYSLLIGFFFPMDISILLAIHEFFIVFYLYQKAFLFYHVFAGSYQKLQKVC